MQNETYFDDLIISNVKDMTFPYSANYTTQVYLPGLFSMEMIYEGEVYLHIENEITLLKAPVVFCTGGNSRFYYFKHTERKKPYRHLWIDFQGPRGIRIFQAFFHAFSNGHVELSSHATASVFNIFEEMNHDFHNPEFSDPDAMVLKMERLMYFLMNDFSRRTAASQDPFRLRELYESIQLGPLAEYDLEKLAGERNISVVYLRKLFKEHYGIPIRKYIAIKQLEKSAMLISERKYRISEISDMCGFSNLSAFTRAFRNTFGMAPHSFQKHFPADQCTE